MCNTHYRDWLRSRGIVREPKPRISRLELNDCVLVRADEGRCDPYIHCRNGSHANLYDVPRENDCCWRVSRLNWGGWRCRICRPDIVLAAEEIEIMLTFDWPSCQGMAVEG